MAICKWKKKDAAVTVAEVVSRNLGVKNADQMISGWMAKHEKNGYALVGLTRACTRIRSYKGDAVRIIGDYDVDGKMAVSILSLGLKRAGINNVSFRIPRPISEGYGMNMSIVDETEDNTLVITVDNGIAALDEVRALADRKIDCIVTDHHLPKVDDNGEVILPDTDIVIDPNAIEDSADFNGYCGAGIAYKLVLKLLENEGIDDEEFEHKLLTLAAIATIADSVPLVEENYCFVKRGLEYLSTGVTFPGVKALLEVFYLTGHCTETDIGFKLGPAINADNRLYDDAHTAIDLLLAEDDGEAMRLARELKEINENRKNLVKEASAFAEKIVTTYHFENDCPLFVNLGNKVKERLVGIIAGKLAEKYSTPCVCFAQCEDGTFKGSARSFGSVDIHDVLLQADSCYNTFGGHKAACGLSLSGRENYTLMKQITQEYVSACSLRPEKSSVKYWDIEVSYNEIPKVIEELNHYAPFGECNPMPVVKVVGYTAIMQMGQYFKSMTYDGCKFASDKGYDAIGFGFAEQMKGHKPKELVLYGSLAQNYFRGKLTPQVAFEDLDILSEY